MALREINLVPSNILARRQLLRHCSFWVGCLVILLVPIFGFYVYQAGATTAQNRSFANPDDINKHLLQQIDSIKRIQEELELLNKQQADLQAIVGQSDYTKILFKLADTVNSNTWLKSLQIDSGSNPKDPTTLQVSGYSATNEALGNFLNRLGSNPLFDNVVLKHATETLMEKSNANNERSAKRVEFEIACSILFG
jgi:Tfp pilus assembly protein PilN